MSSTIQRNVSEGVTLSKNLQQPRYPLWVVQRKYHAKMSSQPIPIAGVQAVLDPYYRYTMPPWQIAIAKSNTTLTTNINQVASSLHRLPKEVMKILAMELAVSSSWKDGKASLKSIHSVQTLQNKLSRYIDICVLCPACGLPETIYDVRKSTIHHNYNACGGIYVAAKDHPISRIIVASHQGTDNNKRNKKSKRRTKTEKKKTKKTGHQSKKEDAVWESDTDDTRALEQSVKSFRRFLRKEWNPGDLDGAVQELTNRQVAALLPSHDRLTILLRAVLRRRTVEHWKKGIELLIPILLRLVDNASRPRLECHVVAVIEFVCQDYPNYFPILLHQMYEGDVLQEDTILQWANDVDPGVRVYPSDVVDEARRKELRSCSDILLTWFCEAAEEDERSGRGELN